MDIYPKEQWIIENYEQTIKLLDNEELSSVKGLIEHFGERYILCPASRAKDHNSAFPGGLCYHNLLVMSWMSKFDKLVNEKRTSTNTIVKLSILHEIGKLGNLEKEYFVKNQAQYYIDKGLFYEFNQEIQFMKVCDRSLYLCSHFGIKLSEDEYVAILLNDEEKSSTFTYNEPQLSSLLKMSVNWARKIEKQNIVHWPEVGE